jgi:DNA primase
MMDADDPGVNASNIIAKKIEDLGGNAYKIYLPLGMDPDDFSKNYHLDFLSHEIQDMINNGKKSLYIKI